MDKDIVPDLLELINSEFDTKALNSDVIKQAVKKLRDKRASYKDANDFAIEVGDILVEVFKDNISAEILPDGRMYYNIAERIMNETLGKNHELIAGYSEDVQALMNEQAQIGIKAQKADLNQSRIDGMVERLAKEEDYNKIKWMMDEPVKNFSQSIVDDSIRKNVEFHARAGLGPKIIRRSTGKCCDWCNEISGTYDYKDAPKDIYRRHRFCRCTVEYNPGDGKRQNVHTKKWIDSEKDAKIEVRKLIARDGTLKVIKKYQRGSATAYDVARELGYNPIPAERVVDVLREDSKVWIKSLSSEQLRGIQKYTDNGIDADGKKLFTKINGYFTNTYVPVNAEEKEIIFRNFELIQSALSDNFLKHDIIVYRYDKHPDNLQGATGKFLSTAVTQKGVIGWKPNIEIIVPKGTPSAYVELLSNFPKQRELLLNYKTELKLIASHSEKNLYEVIINEEYKR